MKKYTFIFIFAILLSACKDKENTDPCSGGDLQKAMLVNVAENIIIPGYANLKEKVDALQNKMLELPANPAAEGDLLVEMQLLHTALAIAYNRVAQFEFGPAADIALRSRINNFPLDTAAMYTKVRNQEYDFSALDTYDKGIPALGWMLFRLDGAEFSLEEIDYMLAMIENIRESVDPVYDAWFTDYRATFKENTGNAAGTSLSLLVNGLNEHYEIIKRDKVGIPAGILTLGFTNPEKVEAYHNFQSLVLINNALAAARNLYLGRSFDGIDETGLDDLLLAMQGERDGATLNTAIQTQFNKTLLAFNSFDESLFTEITNNPEEVQAAYVALAENVVHLKTDLPSMLCVSITYVDNPSDSD